MTIGILQLELSIPEAMSLKDKRRVVKSVKDKIAHRHNVSVAEVGALDEWRTAILGIAMVGNDHKYVEGGLQAIVNYVRANSSAILIDQQIDFV